MFYFNDEKSSNQTCSGSVCFTIETTELKPTRICSGDIVSKNKLLTAGHCNLKAGESAFVRCSNSGERMYPVKGQLIHPRYTGKKIDPFEYALFQVNSDFVNFKTVRFPKHDNEIYFLMKRGECAIFAYGRNILGSAGSLVGGQVYAASDVSLGFEMIRINKHSPAYVQKGDSGGGLFCRRKNQNKWIRIGTLSNTTGTIAAAVPLKRSIVSWIKNHLRTKLPSVTNSREVSLPETSPDAPLEETEARR